MIGPTSTVNPHITFQQLHHVFDTRERFAQELTVRLLLFSDDSTYERRRDPKALATQRRKQLKGHVHSGSALRLTIEVLVGIRRPCLVLFEIRKFNTDLKPNLTLLSAPGRRTFISGVIVDL